jgi:SAM-dependent methyltransferase
MDVRLEREREFHDRAFAENVRAPAKRFYAVNGTMLSWYERTLSACAEGARALEYGCGPGSRAFHLARAGAQVVGIDISPVAIEQATQRGREEGLSDRLEFKVMDAEHLDFPDASFDLVCGSGILHHLSLERSYAELARVLKPSGAGVFTEPLGHNPAINAYRNRTPTLRTVDEHPLLMRDLELAGRFFGEVQTRFFTLCSLAAIALRDRPGFERVLALLDGLDRLLFRTLPPLRRHAWMVGIVLRRPRRAGIG